jgi:hypothetical protein
MQLVHFPFLGMAKSLGNAMWKRSRLHMVRLLSRQKGDSGVQYQDHPKKESPIKNIRPISLVQQRLCSTNFKLISLSSSINAQQPMDIYLYAQAFPWV